MRRFISFGSFIIVVCLLFLLYLWLDSISIAIKQKEEIKVEIAEKQLLNDAFIMGASIYRQQVLITQPDSIITKLDSMFIQEVREFNDTLATETLHGLNY